MLKATWATRSMVHFNSRVTVCKLAARRQQGVTAIHDVAKPKQRESYFNSAQFCCDFFFSPKVKHCQNYQHIDLFKHSRNTPIIDCTLSQDATLKQGVKCVSQRVTESGSQTVLACSFNVNSFKSCH